MATISNLDSWLADTIGNPARRAAVRALVDSLDDFRAWTLRTTGGSPLLETVEPERYVMA